MGQKFSQSKENIVIKVFLDKYFPNFRLLQVLNNGIMYKTLLINKEKAPLVVKVFVKKNYDENDTKIFNTEKENLISLQKIIYNKELKIHPTIAPLINLEDSYLCGMIFRQYFEYSLKERMYLNPYLTEIEKIWITFQLLQCLKDMKDLKIIHGDLNPENVLLTSNLSVYLSDIASFKPACINMDDIASYTYYFGSNDNTSLKGFYLAPERLVEKGSNIFNEKTFAMDVFSLGVIIAELFIEKNIFRFSSMINYKKGNTKLFDIEEYLKKIKNEKIKQLIYKMIKINPDERINIEDALDFFREEICPITMKGFLIHLNLIINNTIFWQPDLIIGYIYRYWNPIWKMIFGPEDKPIPLNNKLNLEIINLIILKNPINVNSTKSLLKKDENEVSYYDKNKFIINILTNQLIINNNNDNPTENIFEKNNNKDCVLIIINFLVKNMKNVKYESSNLAAMEMVKNLSSKLPDIFNLKNIIPYLVDNLERKSYTTKLISVNYIFEILYSFNYNELVLPITEYNYFDSYIFPALLRLYYSEKHELILEFFNNVDKMIDIEEKFLNITLKSRLIKYKNSLNNTNEANKNNSNQTGETQQEKANINNNIINKKDKKDEIFKDYETSLKLFKDELFKVTMDLIGKINEIDILIASIRKLPNLMSFYGKSKSSDFLKFIVNNFNKPDWIIQKEILMQIPKMIGTLGAKVLNDYLLLCIEMLISNNSNEIKTYELIKTIHELLKMGYLQHDSASSIFTKLLPYLVHPNLLIRYELVDLTKSIINYLTQDEIYELIFQSLKEYFNIPIVGINSKNVEDILKYRKLYLDRIIFQMELNSITYEKNIDDIDNISLPLIQNIISLGRNGDVIANDNGDINYSYDQFNIKKDFESKIRGIKKYNVKDIFDDYIKYIIKNNDENSVGYRINELIGKIFWICSETEDTSKKKNFFYDESNSLMSSEFFNFLKIFKILGIPMKLYNFTKLNEIAAEANQDPTLINTSSSNNKEKSHLLENYYFNKSFNNWRPQGQLISTLYFHNNNPVLKLIPLKQNKICSFDSSGTAILWEMFKKDDNFHTKKEYIYKSQSFSKTPILYKNCITLIDNIYFIIASKDTLYQYEPEYSNQSSTKLCQTKSGTNITCLQSIGKDSMELQNIIFCTEKGEINIYDQRTHKISLEKNISFDSGRPLCIKESFENNSFYIGTTGGKILEYDLRFNSILNEYSYYNGDPILNITPYQCNKLNLGELFSGNNDLYNGKYLIISTASHTHEVGFWNINTTNCDILLQVNNVKLTNQTKDNNIFLTDVDYPMPLRNILYDKYTSGKKNNISIDYLNLMKYNYIPNNNYIKLLSMRHAYDDFYMEQFPILEKIYNISNNKNTVQIISTPFCDKVNININKVNYINTPYIMTGGNDSIIRYWDITSYGINNINGNNLNDRGSYIINAPNYLTYCKYSKSSFSDFIVLQSNESCDDLGKKNNMVGFSEYQNYNGITYHPSPQNEFEANCPGDLKYCTKISEPAHKGVINDLLCFGLNLDEGMFNILASCSSDGSIKIWK